MQRYDSGCCCEIALPQVRVVRIRLYQGFQISAMILDELNKIACAELRCEVRCVTMMCILLAVQ